MRSPTCRTGSTVIYKGAQTNRRPSCVNAWVVPNKRLEGQLELDVWLGWHFSRSLSLCWSHSGDTECTHMHASTHTHACKHAPMAISHQASAAVIVQLFSQPVILLVASLTHRQLKPHIMLISNLLFWFQQLVFPPCSLSLRNDGAPLFIPWSSLSHSAT